MRWLIALMLATVSYLFGQETLSADEIIRRVNGRDSGGDSELHLKLKFRDFRRGDHFREVDVRRKLFATGYRSTYRMTEPEHLVGISLLVAEDRAAQGMWMYLPNADHLFPVVTRGLSALASDFSCEDLRLSFPLSDYQFHNLGPDTLEGRKCYRVEMVPRSERLQSELGFAKSIGWVLDGLWIIGRADYFDGQGQVFKSFQAAPPENIQGVWTVKRYTMTNHRAQHATDAEVVEIHYHLKLSAAAFEPPALRAWSGRQTVRAFNPEPSAFTRCRLFPFDSETPMLTCAGGGNCSRTARMRPVKLSAM